MKRPTSLGARHGLTVLAIGALALAACSGGGGGSGGVASLSDSAKKASSNSSGSGRATSTADFRTQLLAYAKCMRDNGVDFPDPQFDSNGRPQFTRRSTPGQGQGQGGNFADLRNSPTFAKARTACQSKQPDFAGQFQRTPAEQATARKNLLKFAKCMRSKGVDFPDPTFDANGRPEFNRDGAPGGAVGQLRNDPTARTAFSACQKVAGGTGRGGFGFGGGPGGPPPGAGGGGNGGSTGAAAGSN